MNQRFNHMQGIVAVVATLIVLGGCAAQQGAAVQAAQPPFVVAGATDVTVEVVGRSAWRISYQAPGAPTTWYAALARRLAARGWTSTDQVTYAPLNRSYSRATPLGVAVVWDWAFFSFDPQEPEVAHIRVQRAIDVPWWRQLRRLVGDVRRAVVPLLP